MTGKLGSKEIFTSEIFCKGAAFPQDMYKYEWIWAEKDQINNFHHNMDITCELSPIRLFFKLRESQLLGND